MTDSLLPFNATKQERDLEAVTARVSDVPVLVRESWDPASCPAALLPWLAWAFSVDFWNDAWTTEQKRAVIAASFSVHSRKGTRAAVFAQFEAVGATGEIVEWWQMTPKGTPHTFRVDLDTWPDGMTNSQADSLENQIISSKPARSHFDMQLMVTPANANIYLGMTTHDLVTTTIYPE